MKITTILIIILLSGCSVFSEKMEELQRLRCEDSSSSLCAGFND